MHRLANQSDGFRLSRPTMAGSDMKLDNRNKIEYYDRYQEELPVIEQSMIKVMSIPFKINNKKVVIIPYVSSNPEIYRAPRLKQKLILK